jgi:hypothetical protein
MSALGVTNQTQVWAISTEWNSSLPWARKGQASLVARTVQVGPCACGNLCSLAKNLPMCSRHVSAGWPTRASASAIYIYIYIYIYACLPLADDIYIQDLTCVN